MRDYQATAVEAVRARARAGTRAVLLVCPTGGGKTRMGVELVRGSVARGGRFLWLAHRGELVIQALETLERAGVSVAIDGEVSTIQKLVASGARPPADVVVFDEAHHAKASEWSKVLDAYRGAVLIGLTATPQRGDGQPLGDMFGGLVVAAGIRELTDRGHLVPCRVVAPASRLDRGIAADPLTAYREHAAGTQAIVFCQHVAHATQTATSFVRAGIPTGIVTDRTHWLERQNTVARFRDGELRVLVNVNILTEGFDAPATQTCILARSCGSVGAYLQMVGRVLRPAEGKTEALLLDLRGSVHEHGMPDEERTYSLDGEGIARAEPCKERYCRVCGCLLEGPTCEDCEIGQKPVEMPVITGAALVAIGARIRAAFDERDAYWRQLQATAQARGYAAKWASIRFRERYGVWRAA